MIWAGFSATGKTSIAFCTNNLSSLGCTQILEQHLIPYITTQQNIDFIYQQDNAPIHTSWLSKAWFTDHRIELLDWPARSPDLNPIENLWSLLSCKVYRNGQQQFDTVDWLKMAIVKCWNKIQVKMLTTLVESMSKRCLDCVEAYSNKVAY